MEDLEAELTKTLELNMTDLSGVFTLDVTKYLRGQTINCKTLTLLHTTIIRAVAYRCGWVWNVFPAGSQVFVSMYNSFYT